MGRLKKYAKESKKEIHQYPWKVDIEIFALWSAYSELFNMSVNEALTVLVKDELKDFLKEIDEERQKEIIEDFLKSKKKLSKGKSGKGKSAKVGSRKKFKEKSNKKSKGEESV